MSQETVRRSPQVVANQLGITLELLHRWSDEFSDFLSIDASGPPQSRRYTDGDVASLVIIQELLDEEFTYEQVRQQLNGQGTFSADISLDDEAWEASEAEAGFEGNDVVAKPGDFSDEERERALVASNEGESPALTFLTNTLTTLSDSQKSILNSQAANRELLGVLLQDNFNLKEENNRLRERILEVERDVARSRQEDEWRREALRQELDAKITSVQQQAVEAVSLAQTKEVPPEITQVETKPGCLGMLFGQGSSQTVTSSRRKKGKVPGRRGQAAGQPEPSGPAHPKPMFPPE